MVSVDHNELMPDNNMIVDGLALKTTMRCIFFYGRWLFVIQAIGYSVLMLGVWHKNGLPLNHASVGLSCEKNYCCDQY